MTILQIKNGKAEVIKFISTDEVLYQLEVGEWNIQAQLDATKPVALQVTGNQSKSLFSYGNLPIVFLGKTYVPQIAGSSLLLETNGNKIEKQEVVDELPDVAKYDLGEQ